MYFIFCAATTKQEKEIFLKIKQVQILYYVYFLVQPSTSLYLCLCYILRIPPLDEHVLFLLLVHFMPVNKTSQHWHKFVKCYI